MTTVTNIDLLHYKTLPLQDMLFSWNICNTGYNKAFKFSSSYISVWVVWVISHKTLHLWVGTCMTRMFRHFTNGDLFWNICGLVIMVMTNLKEQKNASLIDSYFILQHEFFSKLCSSFLSVLKSHFYFGFYFCSQYQ